MAVEAIARAHGVAPFRKSFHAFVADGRIRTRRAVLMMPQTFMNDSGRAVAEAVRFFRLAAQDVTVLHDELDLPLAKVRIKSGGSDAGHNGLRSISAHIGAGYKRVRLGIGHPGDKALVHSYVLSDFSKAETTCVEALCSALASNADLLMTDDDAGLQNKIHLALSAEGFADAPSSAAPKRD